MAGEKGIPVNIEGVGTVIFPAGYTPERITFAIENDILPKVNAMAPAKGRPAPKDFSEPEKPSGFVRFGRGMADVWEGGRQIANWVGDRVQGIEGDSPETAAYTRDRTAENELYERGRQRGAITISDLVKGQQGDPGIDWWRLGGNVAATLPAVAVPGGASMKLLNRMGAGAAGGAIASGVQFVPEGESRAQRTAEGAVLGGVAPAAIQAVKGGAGRLMDFVRPSVSTAVPQQAQRIAGELEIKLQQQGVDWNKLTTEVRSSLMDDAAKTLNAGGTLDDVMLQRKALIESVGAKPTRAAVSRAPKDWQEEMNLRGGPGGEVIMKRHSDNAAAMQDYLQKLRTGTGGKTGTAIETGESAVGAIKKLDADKDAAVGKLYDAFRASGAQDAAVPPSKIADAMGKVADEIGHENIPPAVMTRLREFGLVDGKQTKLLTVNEADKLNRLLNNNNPGNGPASTAIGRIKAAVNQALLDVEPAGKEGVEALKTARAAAAQRFAERDASAGISAAVDDVAPDRFVQKFIINAPARDMKATLAELRKSADGVQAVKDVKGRVMDTLLMKATGASNVDDLVGKPFSGARFGKALDAIEPEKLHALFSLSEVESLRALQKASKLLTEEVPFSDVNHSKTAAALANLLQKIGSTPLLGQVVGMIAGPVKFGVDWAKNATDRKQVAEILLGSAAKGGERAKLPPAAIERFAPAGAAAVATDTSKRTDE